MEADFMEFEEKAMLLLRNYVMRRTIPNAFPFRIYNQYGMICS